VSYHARTWLIRSRAGRIRVGRSGSQQAPHAADQGRPLLRGRAGRVRVRRRWSALAPQRTKTGAGPTTELSCQNVADPEPGGPYPSRTKREPTSPTRCGPRPELDPRSVATEPGWPSPSRTEREPTRLDLGRSRTQRGAGAESQGISVTRALVEKARTATWRETTNKDPGLRLYLPWSRGLCPMCPDSDGF
jgi:hypothetical protein